MKQVTCRNCGWVHMGVSRAYAESQVAAFNDFYESLTKQQQFDLYGGKPASIEQYEGCWRCKGTRFREAAEGDCPVGCTLNPVVISDELLASIEEKQAAARGRRGLNSPL